MGSAQQLKRSRMAERCVFLYDGREFQALGQFCNFAKPILTSTKSPGRLRLLRHRDSGAFRRRDTLWVAAAPKDVKALHQSVGCTDLFGDPRAKLDSDFADRRSA